MKVKANITMEAWNEDDKEKIRHIIGLYVNKDIYCQEMHEIIQYAPRKVILEMSAVTIFDIDKLIESLKDDEEK